MFSSQDIKVAKNRKFQRLLWDMSDFWSCNISKRKCSFELKFSGHSTHKYTSLWARSQLEIPSFDLLAYTMS
jgi:hypothetical protein